ncbi:RraA family protein [Anaerosphaera multitolerans]|uniref:Putative 4-hydroxy-4-methyl-2-oxoglutarate aldolase n=1 Tax=Anaerosphaera multitolerans TaxID=2487351 RepID=A0A437S8V4_9FIRM|nr:RraA family protein [Anaerosphaera multitolerans]RVU55539.1 RraA family protein [Anaerosphaera multitolerans]
MEVNNRIFLKRYMLEEKILREYENIPTANIGDAMFRLSNMDSRIKLISTPNKIVVGRAITVKARSGDNLMLHKALDIGGPDDFIVVSNDGGSERALMGEIMAIYAEKVRNISGIIIDGPIRDVDELSKMGMAIYATGITPKGPYKEGPGEINTPITCGEQVVLPGDLIVADSDGVAVIHYKDVKQILDKIKEFQKNDFKKVQLAKEGKSDRKWVDKKLFEKKVEFLEKVY